MFDVHWEDAAIEGLMAAMALVSPDEQNLMAAVFFHADELLRFQPDSLGESRDGNQRFVAL